MALWRKTYRDCHGEWRLIWGDRSLSMKSDSGEAYERNFAVANMPSTRVPVEAFEAAWLAAKDWTEPRP